VTPEPRPREQRRRDTEQRLNRDIDLWLASASTDGAPYLVPLSFDWDGGALLVATPLTSTTGRNLAATRTTRVALGGPASTPASRARPTAGSGSRHAASRPGARWTSWPTGT
jgi:hypothetical protein